MPNFFPRVLTGTVVAILVVAAAVVLAVGCSKPSNTRGTKTCDPGTFFDSKSGSCITPANESQGLELATRSDLEVLRDAGDPITLVELRFRNPVDRATATSVLSGIGPTTVDVIGFFFPNVDGGFQVQATTKAATADVPQLLNQARTIVTSRYASLEEPALASQLGASLDNASEEYLALRMHALPSRLLSVWSLHPEIAYISVEKGAP